MLCHRTTFSPYQYQSGQRAIVHGVTPWGQRSRKGCLSCVPINPVAGADVWAPLKNEYQGYAVTLAATTSPAQPLRMIAMTTRWKDGDAELRRSWLGRWAGNDFVVPMTGGVIAGIFMFDLLFSHVSCPLLSQTRTSVATPGHKFLFPQTHLDHYCHSHVRLFRRLCRPIHAGTS